MSRSASPRWRLMSGDDQVIASDVRAAGDPVSRLLGLMFRSGLAPGEGLVLHPCNSIHMFFMRFPLDVAFVDETGEVLYALHGIRPWRTSRIVRGAKAAIELRTGTLRVAGVDRGSKLRLEPSESRQSGSHRRTGMR